MSVSQFVRLLRERGLRLTLDGEQLRCNGPQGALTQSMREELASRKQEVVSLLRQESCQGQEFPTVVQLFEEQVSRSPNSTAVINGNDEISYEALNCRSNQLAHQLRDLGVGPETLVAICVDRSIEMIVGLLGILKAGGAYLPLDPNYPALRLEFMLQNPHASILLTQEKLRDRLPVHYRVICLDSELEMSQDKKTENPKRLTSSESLAYVIYTSGSSGVPKGVSIPHRGIVRLVRNTNYMSFQPDDVFLQFAPISFDASTLEIWGPLLNGGRILQASPDLIDAQELAELICQGHVTTAWLTAGLFHHMVENHLPSLGGLRTLLAGGDVLSLPLVRKALQELPNTTLINGYGPTENTTFTTCHRLTSESQLSRNSVSIGTPITNTSVHVVDSNMQLVPQGIAGELYVGGAGLAHGYLNRPDLTAERFVPDRFSAIPGARLYRTGDLVRWLPDGNLEFLGRIDQQVKIRGYRVELGEIEAVLGEHPVVSEIAVLAREDAGQDKKLVAYVIRNRDGQSEKASQPETFKQDSLALEENHAPNLLTQLRSFAEERLPSYMVPSVFLFQDNFPLTANGKLDRRALPAPERSRPEIEQEYVSPRTPTEEILAEMWQELLGLPRVGVRDNFFVLGGHSMLAVRLIADVQRRFEKKLPLASLFEEPTIQKLAEVLESAPAAQSTSTLVTLQAKGDLPPLFLIHPGGGAVFCYLPLAKNLGEDRPIIAIQARGLDGEAQPHQNMEEMASHYVEEIRFVQPEGPYHLAGWSLGATVSYEMARQLTSSGEEVALLAMIDGTPGNREQKPLEEILGDRVWDDAEIIEYALGDELGITAEDLRAGPPEERLQVFLTTAKNAGLFPKEITSDQVKHMLEVYKSNYLALHGYRPGPYSGSVQLYRADNVFDQTSEIDSFLDELTAGQVNRIRVPGDHFSIATEPNVVVLADHINCALAACRSQCSVSKDVDVSS